MAPLQKRAWTGLGMGVIIAAAVLAVFVSRGVDAFNRELWMRAVTDVLIVGGLAAWGALLASVSGIPGRAKASRDERDEEIIRGALSIQLIAVIFSLVAWAVALTEVYWDRGGIPIVFPYLIFLSVLVVNMLAQAAGILVGYRRMG